MNTVYRVSQKKVAPPQGFLAFFQSGSEFFVQILQAYYMFLCTLGYKIFIQ